MEKEQLYHRLDKQNAVVDAMDIIRTGQQGPSIPAADSVLTKRDVMLKLNGRGLVAEAERVIGGEKRNLRAPGVSLREGEVLPEEDGCEAFRVDGELVLLPEATLDDVFYGNSGYTLRQLAEIDGLRKMKAEQMLAIEEAVGITNRTKYEILREKDLAVDAAARIISEYQNSDK